jgi:hypothetical protein
VFIVAVAALQNPRIQTKVVKKLATVISEQIGLPVEIGYVNLLWYDELYVRQISIKDTKGEDMIDIDEITVNFSLSSLLMKDRTHIDDAWVSGVQVSLRNNAPDTLMNISYFIKNLRDVLSSGEGKGKIFSVGKINLENGHFKLNNIYKDSLHDRWDFNHFQLANIDGRFQNMKIVADTFEIDILKLNCLDQQTQMEVKDLKTSYSVSQASMVMKDLELGIGSSTIKNDMVFLYDSLESLSDFNHLVRINADLSHSEIYSKDLGWFAPQFNQYDEFFSIEGQFKGRISRFTFNDFILAFGEKTILQGDLNITGLPDYREALFDIDLDQSYLLSQDFESLLPKEVYEKVKPLDFITADDVALTGFLYDFVAHGKFRSQLGLINSDINLKLNEDADKTTYSGNLALSGFSLGKILGREDLFRQVDMRGTVSGKGLKPENADINLKAFFNYFDFHDYRYRNITADARFNMELFAGSLKINDENIKLDASGLIDLRKDNNKIELTARIDTVFLDKLKFSNEDYFISANIEVDMIGLKLDDFIGKAIITNGRIGHGNRDMNIGYLNITSDKSDSGRSLAVDSELFAVNLQGKFNYSRLFNDLQNQYEEYKMNILNQQDNINTYYRQKKIPLANRAPYTLTYDAKLLNINPVIQLFVPMVYISENTRIQGVFTSSNTNDFTLYSQVDTIDLGNYTFFNNIFDINLSKNIEKADVTASAMITSAQQLISRTERTRNLYANLDWKDKKVDFSSGVHLANSDNSATIKGRLDFLNEHTLITLDTDESVVKMLEKDWLFSKDNSFVIEKRSMQINNVILYNAEQSISLNGAITADSLNKQLVLDVRDFTLDNLNPLWKNNFNGKVNGSINIRNLASDMIWESQVVVQDFQIEKFPVGNITLNSYWNNQVKHLNVGMDVIRNENKIIAMAGHIDPSKKDDQLHIYTYLNKANLNIAEPFIDNLFSRIDGYASGEFLIRGTLQSPQFIGKGLIENGRLKVNYLNTDYTFFGEVTLDEDKIGVDNLIVRDDELNRARLTGGFYHTGMRNFIMDISGRLTNFKVLNTNAKLNDLYYGVAIVSGDISFLGAPTNLYISANATSQRGTRIYIPLGGSSTIEQENFIRFVTRGDTIPQEEEVKKVDLRGLRMDFDLEITPDAYCELIFDIKAGDIIRGRGNGQIKLQIDTESDFKMFGDFEIREGAYNFTLYNVINKEFSIHPNSLITWTGDPYKARMNIFATYDQMASITPLLDPSLWSYTELKRKYPAKVFLELKGDLMSPDINFDIDITDYPTVISGGESGPYTLDIDITAFKNKIKADEQELKRQVFSLMVLRRFSPENSFNVSGSLGNSVSEFISNQLSYWVTQFDENLEIDVDLNSLDQEFLNTFQLRLSYTILDGRLRITRDGGFIHQQNQPSLGSIAGDWTVEYLLTPNGKLRMKMYNKTNYNFFTQSLSRQSQNSTTAGFSLLHTESFDRLNEVFRNIRSRREGSESDDLVPAPEAVLKEEEFPIIRKDAN